VSCAQLGFESYHGGPPDWIGQQLDGDKVHQVMHSPAWQLCAAPPKKLMDVDAFVDEMIPAKRAALGQFVRDSERTSFTGLGPPFSGADMMWPYLYKFLDSETNGTAKFVWWRRNATEWAQSYVDYFNMSEPIFWRVDLMFLGCVRSTPVDRPLHHSARPYALTPWPVRVHSCTGAAAARSST
jgi:hypothetical protein